MTGDCEKIELPEPQLEPCQPVTEPLPPVWSLAALIRGDEKNFRSSGTECFS